MRLEFATDIFPQEGAVERFDQELNKHSCAFRSVSFTLLSLLSLDSKYRCSSYIGPTFVLAGGK
jgi:hypothetical protein